MTGGMIGVGVAHAPVDGMTSETAGVTAALVAVTGVAGKLATVFCRTTNACSFCWQQTYRQGPWYSVQSR